jgi:hypothetical protein
MDYGMNYKYGGKSKKMYKYGGKSRKMRKYWGYGMDYKY